MAVAVLLTVAAGRAHADVGLVLHESLNRGVSRFTGTGHSAVYLSRICAASPVELRWCTPEEEGSVISNYDDFGFGGDRDFEWTAVPLNVFLYGVDRARDAPLWASPRIKALLEERYRIGRLAGYCDAAPCVTDGNSEWRAMVGATFARTVDVFMVATSVEQDREFITRFNTRPNRNRFNGVTRNCADFARDQLNAYFAGGSRTDFVNDFGMTSPKGVARSFTRFARRSPDLQYRVLHFPQLAGTVTRSNPARVGTEQLFRSKKFLALLLFLEPRVVPAFALVYYLTGRFDPRGELEHAPTARATEIRWAIKSAAAARDREGVARLKAELERERTEVLGSPEEWRGYRDAFARIVTEAERSGFAFARQPLDRVFQRLDEAGLPLVDGAGVLWMGIPNDAGMARVGLTANTVLAADSDAELACRLMLARVDRALRSPSRTRPTMTAFREDWALLKLAWARLQRGTS